MAAIKCILCERESHGEMYRVAVGPVCPSCVASAVMSAFFRKAEEANRQNYASSTLYALRVAEAQLQMSIPPDADVSYNGVRDALKGVQDAIKREKGQKSGPGVYVKFANYPQGKETGALGPFSYIQTRYNEIVNDDGKIIARRWEDDLWRVVQDASEEFSGEWTDVIVFAM